MKRNTGTNLVLLIFIVMLLSGCSENQKFFAGRFTERGGNNGLYLFDMKRNGELIQISQFDVGPNPSFFCYDQESDLIYVVNEVMSYRGEQGGGLTTLRYLPELDSVVVLDDMRIPKGGPCHISLSPGKDYLLIANYENASVLAVRLNRNKVPETITDTILYDFRSYNVSHAHMIKADPAGEFIYVTDLGKDSILIYRLDISTGKLNQIENGGVKLPVHDGPRHFVFNKEGTKMYVINELGSTLSVLNRNENGRLTLLKTYKTLPEDYEENNYCAEIQISNDGRFIYGSNRGHNSIVVFRIEEDGLLSLVGHVPCGGDWPRNFTLDPSGKYLLAGNQKSGDISVFKINRRTGMPEGPVKTSKIPDVACMVFW